MSFPLTHWSIVVKAKNPEDFSNVLGYIYTTYREPLIAYGQAKFSVPRWQAEDFLQSFFKEKMQANWLQLADQERGSFRSYLKKSYFHHALNILNKERTKRRGGGAIKEELEALDREIGRGHMNASMLQSPDLLYERMVLMAWLGNALESLRQDHARRGRETRFALLCPFLTSKGSSASRAVAAQKLGTSANGLSQLLRRLKRELRKHILAEIGRNVSEPGQAEQELSYLLGVV